MRKKVLISIACVFLILFSIYYIVKLGIRIYEASIMNDLYGKQYDNVFIQCFSQIISVVLIVCCILTIETFYLSKDREFIKTDNRLLNKLADLEIPFSFLAIGIELFFLFIMKFLLIPNFVSTFLLIIHGGIAIYPGCFFIINIAGKTS